jgi:DNA-binding transcriptional regulator YiaG
MKPGVLKQWRASLRPQNPVPASEAATMLKTPLSTYYDWEAGRAKPPGCLSLACAHINMITGHWRS